MQIETLKVFCDVVESRSFSAAAAQNFITQSAVSQQIRALETRFDRKLIERTRGNVQVTPAGEILYQSSKEIVQRYLEMTERLQALSHVVGGTLRIATVYSVGLYELSAPLRWLRDRSLPLAEPPSTARANHAPRRSPPPMSENPDYNASECPDFVRDPGHPIRPRPITHRDHSIAQFGTTLSAARRHAHVALLQRWIRRALTCRTVDEMFSDG